MIKQFTVNHFCENTYIVWDDSLEAAIIDLGAKTEMERQNIYGFIEKEKLKIKYLLLTHSHIDHFCGFKYAMDKFSLPLTMSKDAKKMLNISLAQADIMGFPPIDMKCAELNLIQAGDEIVLGNNYVIKTIEASGHCPGSLAYYSKQDNAVFVGDAIFNMSIGRTDLYGGNLEELVNNIKNNILSLPLDTDILCGHGPVTDVEYERSNNPYVK